MFNRLYKGLRGSRPPGSYTARVCEKEAVSTERYAINSVRLKDKGSPAGCPFGLCCPSGTRRRFGRVARRAFVDERDAELRVRRIRLLSVIPVSATCDGTVAVIRHLNMLQNAPCRLFRLAVGRIERQCVRVRHSEHFKLL